MAKTNSKAEAEIKSTLNETSLIVEDALRSITEQIGEIFKNAIDRTSSYSKTLANDIKGNLNELARGTDVLEKNQAKLNKGDLTRADITKQIEARQLKIQSIEKIIRQ
jgi:5-bromo-4-chloroindolyl phosphate hydrolysis protein